MMHHVNEIVSEPLDTVLRMVLLGNPVDWPETAQESDRSRFLETTFQHGIQPLLYYNLVEAKCLRLWPEDITIALKNESVLQTIHHAMLKHELRQILSALAKANIFPLLIKGTPLSYTHYAFPYLRPHCDTDLLIQKCDLESAIDILIDLSYVGSNAVTGDLVSHQVTYTKEIKAGIRFQLDLHWKLTNPHLFADTFSFVELEHHSIKLPALGEHARTLGNVHALLLACVHRIAHHYDSDYLLWLYDIHLLASNMSRTECEEFVRLAADRQLRAICLRGLHLARHWFNTQLPEGLIDRWLLKGGAAAESSERYIRPAEGVVVERAPVPAQEIHTRAL
jgi:hypothetical protein